MKRILFVAFFLIPFLAVGQERPLSPKKSKAIISALAKLKSQYFYVNYLVDSETAIATDSLYREGIVDLKGQILLPFQYTILPQENSSLLMVVDDSLMGFVDGNGRWVLPLQFDKSGECACGIHSLFTGGHCSLSKNGLYGIINTKGEFIVPCSFDHYCFLINDNLLLNYENDSYLMYISDLNGVALTKTYNYLTPFFDGLAAFRRDHLYGYVDKNGTEVIAEKYQYAGSFFDGKALVKQDGMWKFIDKNENTLLSIGDSNIAMQDLFHDFKSYNLFFYKIHGLGLGATNLLGDTIIPFKYSYAPLSFDNGKHIIMSYSDDQIDVYNNDGTFLDHFDGINYYDDFEDEITAPSPVFHAINKKGLWGFVDSNFNIVVPCQFRDSYIFDNGIGVVTLDDGQQAAIDMQGNILVKGPFVIIPLGKNLFKFSCHSNDKPQSIIEGYIDTYGNSTASRKEMRIMRSWLKERNSSK